MPSRAENQIDVLVSVVGCGSIVGCRPLVPELWKQQEGGIWGGS